MGILLSFLFPRQFMYTEQSASSTASTTTSSTPAHSPDPDTTPPPSPPLASSSALPSATPPRSNISLSYSSPSEARQYIPHAVGLGVLSPRPNIGSFSPLHQEYIAQSQARLSPPLQRHNPFSSPLHQTSANVFSSPHANPVNPFDNPEFLPPASPSLALAEAEAANATQSPPDPSSLIGQLPSSPSAKAAGLCIAIPPQHHLNNPFMSHDGISPPASVTSPGTSRHGEPLQSPPQSSASDPGQDIASSQMTTDLNLDFAEFDSDGLSTLEKIYLFSRSRAGFQRVFIAHALPGFLRSTFRSSDSSPHSSDAGHPEAGPSQDYVEADEITPAEAVEYVLPLLNGLAMDEDEAVKEALATELVPIIWWFITHCKLVEDDPSALPTTPSSQPELLHNDGEDGQVRMSVQSFTPILGTLLLSQNGMVGGPARFAVVELLNRVRRADGRVSTPEEREKHQSNVQLDSLGRALNLEEDRGGTELFETQLHHGIQSAEEDEDQYSPLGLFGCDERRMFEREMVQQVVIGMGRLDLSDEGAEYATGEPAMDPTETPVMPTPQAAIRNALVEVQSVQVTQSDSYFPMVPRSTATQEPSIARPQPSFETADGVNEPALVISPLPILSPSPSPSLSPASILSTPSLSPASILSSTSSSTSVSNPSSASPTPLPSNSSIPLNALPMLSPPLEGPDQVNEIAEDWAHVSPRNLGPPLLSPQLLSPRISSPRPSLSSVGPISPRAQSPRLLGSSPLRIPSPASASSLASELPRSPISDIALPVTEITTAPLYTASEGSLSEGSDGAEADMLDETQMNEEASVGRLSSMSLMAAVTASGAIDEETKASFVSEVERVGRDPVYWVRREACFAVGALAKVVPQEVVISSLLPLLELLSHDLTWHVRHSALFALPAILSRLPPPHRRSLALDVVLSLARDESATVRSAVLEALAEVIYTFNTDEEGPPGELLRLFLGIREDDDPRKSDQIAHKSPTAPSTSPMSWADFVASMSSGANNASECDIYDDPSRPLVCAFNYPAVALTLGRDRWPELRDLYLSLSQNSSFKVRRTLAASLGEMAKIIGPEHSRQDLLGVWWESVRSGDADVRLKAIECVDVFMGALPSTERAEVVRGLEGDVWQSLKGWREREAVMKALEAFMNMDDIETQILRRLLRKGLIDPVATVRETAVSTFSVIIRSWSSQPSLLEDMLNDLRGLCRSTSYRQRMTFIACYQDVLLSTSHNTAILSEPMLRIFVTLAQDPIVDVRIRMARFLGIFQDNVVDISENVSRTILELADRLSNDPSHDVRAFAVPIAQRWPIVHRRKEIAEVARSAANFHRPPPLAPS